MQSDMKKALSLLLFLVFTNCQNVSKMNPENKHDLTFKIVYKQSTDSVPALSKYPTIGKNGHEYSRIDIPNPELAFPRKFMELYGTSEALIGRYVSENGTRDNHFFSILNDSFDYHSDSDVIDLAVTSNGDFLKLTSDFLYIVKKDNVKIQHPLKGMKIILSENKDIWVIGINNAWLIEDDYTKIKALEWFGGIHTVSYQNALHCIDNSKSVIVSLDTKGIVTNEKTKENFGPFEKLAGFWGSKYITLEGSTFRWYEKSVLKRKIALQSAGVLNNGEVFISYTENKKTYLKTNTISKEWDIPEDSKSYILPIVFEKGDSYFGYHLNSFGEFSKKDQKAQETNNIDEKIYEKNILPYRWKIGQSRYFNIPNYNKLLVSLVGPKEIILMEINSSF
ncbi:conserved protein of unknown function [Flavobacterium collinsii]|uniref:Uncharacterized protein n=2 Tax=Flavobacterium collinsii TaxID=1114861 RepID=A0A9W4X3D5_9FLAO|nr:conserved protein of unknown function [Flavobacterium collinsii]